MANQPTQTHSPSSATQQDVPNNPLARMVQELDAYFIERGSMLSPTSPKAGEQGSQSRTRTYQVSFIAVKNSKKT